MTVYNTAEKISKRKIGELEGLKISILEKSLVNSEFSVKDFKIIKPLKFYKNKTKILPKYTIKNKF